jgi:hypothetical protein
MFTAARSCEGPGGVSLRDTTMTSATRAKALPEAAGTRREGDKPAEQFAFLIHRDACAPAAALPRTPAAWAEAPCTPATPPDGRHQPSAARPMPRIAALPRSASARRDCAQPDRRRQRISAWREGKPAGWPAPAV